MNDFFFDIQKKGAGRLEESSNGQLQDLIVSLQSELAQGLALYWETAGRILENSGIRLKPPDQQAFSLEHNFFSALFLYSYYRGHIPKTHRIFYAAVNQCLRGMVTGCDNILDEEYKITLNTDLPESGTRFRSVLDIMVSDRALFEILLEVAESAGVSVEVVKKAMRASLQTLARSGAQEASEQAGIQGRRLSPQAVLDTVHHYKTGLLFQCPWALPAVMEQSVPENSDQMKKALYQIGLGCQILDDMVDLVPDVQNRRHNYVASLIEWAEDQSLKRRLAAMTAPKSEQPDHKAQLTQPLRHAYQDAMTFLDTGLSRLFHEDHQALIAPCTAFIVARIGAPRFDSPGQRGDA